MCWPQTDTCVFDWPVRTGVCVHWVGHPGLPVVTFVIAGHSLVQEQRLSLDQLVEEFVAALVGQTADDTAHSVVTGPDGKTLHTLHRRVSSRDLMAKHYKRYTAQCRHGTWWQNITNVTLHSVVTGPDGKTLQMLLRRVSSRDLMAKHYKRYTIECRHGTWWQNITHVTP